MKISRGSFLHYGAGAAAFAIVPAPARAAEFEFRLATNLTIDHPFGVGTNEFAVRVGQESRGRIAVKVFPNSQLGGDTYIIQQTLGGAIQFALIPGDVLSAVVPISGIERVGFAFPDDRSVLAAMNGDLGAYIAKEIQAKGFHTFQNIWDGGYRQITTSTHPIRTISDLSGVKLRVPPAQIATDLFRALGASPTPLQVPEMYPAMQSHLVDGMEGSYANLLTFRAYEVQKYMSVTNHQWTGLRILMNPGAWQSLPPDLQAIVNRNANLAATRASRDLAVQNESIKDKLSRLGLATNQTDTSSVRNRLGDYYAHWKREFGPTAWSLMEKYAGKLG